MKRKMIALLLMTMLLTGSVFGMSSALADNSGRTDIVIALSVDPALLHPADFTSSDEMDVLNQLYDTLYLVSFEGKEPQPRLATSYEISEDGLQYTFHLRKDATFHDGTPIKASDVVFSANLYKDSVAQNSKVTGMASVEAIDEYTVVFTTEMVYSPFLESIMDMYVASEAYYNEVGPEEFAASPMGSGPYKFVKHDIGTKVVLEAYDGYYMGEAAIKGITFKVLADNTTVSVALQTGEVDFASIDGSNYFNLDGKEGVTITEYEMSRFGFISMNFQMAPYDNIKFRQAVSYAINRQEVIDLALDGFGTVNSNILTPTRFGYSEDQIQYEYNPEKAKELLAECGITTPYDLGTMYVMESYSTLAQVIQSHLAAVGLNVNIERLEANAYYGKLFNGECGITVLAMTLEGNTQMLEMAFLPENIGRANNVRYSDDEITQWFADAVTAIDENARFDIYNKIFSKVQEQAVYVVLYNTVGLYAHSSDLKGMEFELEGRYYVYNFSW